MRSISNDKFVRIYTVQDSEDFNSQPIATENKEREQLVAVMPAIEKTFDILGNDILEFFTGKKSLKNQIDSYNDKLLEESEAMLLEQFDDEKRANWVISTLEKKGKNNY